MKRKIKKERVRISNERINIVLLFCLGSITSINNKDLTIYNQIVGLITWPDQVYWERGEFRQKIEQCRWKGDVESFYFCYLRPHAKFWNPRTNFENPTFVPPYLAQGLRSPCNHSGLPSGRKVRALEDREIKPLRVATMFWLQRPRAAHALCSDQF